MLVKLCVLLILCLKIKIKLIYTYMYSDSYLESILLTAISVAASFRFEPFVEFFRILSEADEWIVDKLRK